MTRNQFFAQAFSTAACALPSLAAQQDRVQNKQPRQTRERTGSSARPKEGAKLDVWSHLLPAAHRVRLQKLPSGTINRTLNVAMSMPELFDTDARFRTMDKFGDYSQILTPVPGLHLGLALTDPDLASELVLFTNDCLAELVTKHPDRFRGFAAVLPMHDPDKALQELDRVAGMRTFGIQIETNINGLPLDHERLEPLFSRMAQLSLAIWIHPFRLSTMADYASEKTSRYTMASTLGWPYETAVTLSRLVFCGLFDRYPKLKIIGHHGGGMIPHFSGRLGHYLEVWGPRLDEDLDASLSRLKKPLLDYFRMFYVDTALNGAKHAVRCVVDFFGPDHVLFGTDTPFDPEPGEFIRGTISDIRALGMNDATQNAILGGNAIRLLGVA